MYNAEETGDRPKWLLELENRKRKPRLAHEAGAGAPCMVCSTACPGLDLHFWRKICKNCKCSRDDHDVDDDDFPQFDLLFGPSKKFKKKPIILHVNNEKQNEGEAAFEWVPPDTTKELATDYMKALPAEKLPIKGSAGAALRRQLLQKQLPLHDIDYKACDELSEQEMKQFEKYLENIKKYVGQGKVTKILGARPFDRSLMTPANATDMQRVSPQHRPNIPGSMVQLRTPSSFSPKTAYSKNLFGNQNKQDSCVVPEANNQNNKNMVAEKYNVISSDGNTEIARSEAINSGIYNRGVTPIDSVKLDESRQEPACKGLLTEHSADSNPSSGMNFNSPTMPWKQSESGKQSYKDIFKNPSASIVHSEDAQIAESILADAFLPPSMVNANDIIGSTLDEKRLMFIREKLTDKYSNQENQVIHNTPGVSRDLDSSDLLRRAVTSRNQKLPGNIDKETEQSANDETIKKSGNDNIENKPIKAEREIIKPISHTIQSVPLDPINEKQLQPHHSSKMVENLDRRLPMPTCMSNSNTPQANKYKHDDILPPDSAIESPKTPQTQFLANAANHQAKLSSSMVPSNVIHSEKLHNQIFPHDAIGTPTQQIQNLPNVEHLRGAMEELTMESTKSQKCHKCEEEIRVGDVVVITEQAKNASWHPGCFVCSMCNELLVDLVYFHYKNKLYCGRDLATLLGIPRCFACDELIFVREYTVAEGHNYHVKHFCCWDCDVPLAGQQYITENDRPLCLPCYQKTYAKTCNACNKVIAADQQGVAVKNLNFHAADACFCCHTCQKNLLNGRMAVKEDKLFCSKECISQFLRPQT